MNDIALIGPNDASFLIFSVRIASVQVAPGTKIHHNAKHIFMNKGFIGTNDVGMILNELEIRMRSP